MSALTGFSEVTAEPRTVQVPLSHLSVELGHLYMEDFAEGPDYLRKQFGRVKPWADMAQNVLSGSYRTARVSTCFMIDDYFSRFSTPAEVLPKLLKAANDCSLTIDYLARESGCAQAAGIDLAELVQGRLVAEPAPGTNGTRPPVEETGWLCNGQRSPGSSTTGGTEALRAVSPWRPPVENGFRNHSIFADIELWDRGPDGRGRKRWSCSFLAAVWQLLRLGLLRDEGKPVLQPEQPQSENQPEKSLGKSPDNELQTPPEDPFPDSWDELPALLQLRPGAAPFCAYQTLSVLSPRFLSVEFAVRTILERVGIDPDVQAQVLDRSTKEGVLLPREVVERVAYVFLTGDPTG